MIRVRALRTAVAAAAVAFAAAAFSATPAGAQSITGSVRGSGESVVGATVRLLEVDRTFRTGAGGRFTFQALAAGRYTLFLSATGFASSRRTVTVAGTVKQFQYTNPHAWLVIEVPEAGKTTTWSFEMGELSALTRAGIHKQDFEPGTKVTVTGHPMKDGRTAGSFNKAVRADGVTFTPRGVQKAAS